MKLKIALDTKILFLLCIIHINGIDGARTLISQSAEYSVSNGQATDFLLQCAASAGDKDYGHKVNTVTGECSAGDSSDPEIGFTFLDKKDTFQRFINVVPIVDESYLIRVQGGFGYGTGMTVTFKLVSGCRREFITFATADCCAYCGDVFLLFLLDVSGYETGCHYKKGTWLYGSNVYNGDDDFLTDTEIQLDFKFEPSSIKVSKNGAEDYLSCPYILEPAGVEFICSTASVAVISLYSYTI